MKEMQKVFSGKEAGRGQQGFTLIEVLVAMAILVVGLLAVGTMQLSAIRGNFMGGNTSIALTLAGEKMEDLMNRAYTDADLNNAAAGNDADLSSIATTDHEEQVDQNGQVAAGGFYRRIWNVADSASPVMKTMTVIVTWEGNRHRVSVSSLRKQ